ncbi:MAG: ATP-binding protein [Planctomycetes bacterium]|nr:ATP-binding protein [Planctomycetota bacterium]
MPTKIKSRERDAIINSLRSGVVPRVGLQHIQVGRSDEVEAVINDLKRAENGSAFVRFIIGRFGSGKSFFLNLAQMVALERKFVVARADITPDRRLYASDGKARLLYSELMQNLSTKSKPDGGALTGIVERWISDIDYEIKQKGGDNKEVGKEITTKLRILQEYVSGYDFAIVVNKYYEGFCSHNDILMVNAIRWLKGDYTTKSDARKDLGVRSFIHDMNIYDYLKLMARFIQMAGYSGLLINFDEMVVLSQRLNNSKARNSNYEMILRILNDCLQGDVSGIGFIFAGTDEFLEDKRRGLFSYEALATRLSENMFVREGLKDFLGPIIRLSNLSPENLYVLFHNIRKVFANDDSSKYLVPDEGIESFLQHCSNVLGSEYFRTPRDSVKAFVNFLSVLEQNPGTDWKSLLGDTKIEVNSDPESELISGEENENKGDDDLSTFKL